MKRLFRWLRRLLALVLFICLGVFSYYAYQTYQHVKQVETYRHEVAALYPQDKKAQQLALAIILTESKGRGTDVMQSSESLYGTTGQINSPEESIQQGVAHLTAMQTQAQDLGLDAWSAIQAYNFGGEYLNFLKEQGATKTNVSLAEKYSKEVLSPLLGNTTQAQYRYLQISAILKNGGYLYQNGGNFLYVEIVKLNLKWIQLYESFH